MKINLIVSVLLGLAIISCNKKKVGETTVEYSKENTEISIDNFPNGQLGISGLTETSFPEGFSIQKIDEIIYDFVTTKNFDRNNVNVRLRYTGEDKYGNDTVGNWIQIGKIDIQESKKYADYHKWKGVFGFETLLYAVNKVKTKSSLSQEIKDDIMNQLADPSQDEESENQEDEANLITFTYGKGYVTFHNVTKVRVTDLKLAYHVDDGNWSGWMTAGSWSLEPGQKFRFPLPLSPDGLLNKEIYYHCMYKDIDDLLYEIGGNSSFMISNKDEFVVLNADSPTPHNNTNSYFDRFRKLDFGERFKTFTIGIGTEPQVQ